MLTCAKVSGKYVYPGTGMLIMAVEAAKQTVPHNGNLRAFYLKEAVFSKPIVLRPSTESEGVVEAIVNLRPLQKRSPKVRNMNLDPQSGHLDGMFSIHHSSTIRGDRNPSRRRDGASTSLPIRFAGL